MKTMFLCEIQQLPIIGNCGGWGDDHDLMHSLLTDGSHHILIPSDKWQLRSMSLRSCLVHHVEGFEAFAMLGALAWQVNHSNRKDIFVVEGDRMGKFFYPQVLPLVVVLVVVCARAFLSTPPFSLHFLYRIPDCSTTCSVTCADDGSLAIEA
ncbi:hypothetical protein FCM35_KLT09777 [Carex littledalei]|uniref:Uncharacterized protein n=1 Tax=Carex littledalei TaxID=544730 RepID=A0A833VYF9_9POAL|nr:hypothetical protein FCM35_KLT09777 [Carex littledalei]